LEHLRINPEMWEKELLDINWVIDFVKNSFSRLIIT
jgi:hypothetical protein